MGLQYHLYDHRYHLRYYADLIYLFKIHVNPHIIVPPEKSPSLCVLGLFPLNILEEGKLWIN